MLVLARIVEPTSKVDSLRILAEVGVGPPLYAMVKTPPARVCRRGVGRERLARCAPTMPPSDRLA